MHFFSLPGEEKMFMESLDKSTELAGQDYEQIFGSLGIKFRLRT